MLWIFSSEKSDGFGRVPGASMLTIRPPKPLLLGCYMSTHKKDPDVSKDRSDLVFRVKQFEMASWIGWTWRRRYNYPYRSTLCKSSNKPNMCLLRRYVFSLFAAYDSRQPVRQNRTSSFALNYPMSYCKARYSTRSNAVENVDPQCKFCMHCWNTSDENIRNCQSILFSLVTIQHYT
jgi:hypothetical protein